jgi:tetratricopeptide (TPR) repeat protein
MISCIRLFYTSLFALLAAGTTTRAHIERAAWPAAPAAQAKIAPLDEADSLYRNRARIGDAQRATAIWRDRLTKDPHDVVVAWKLARAEYWLAGHASDDAVREAFERGMEAARQAIAAAPNRPEGHFWLAANMAGLAETQGMRAGLRYRTPIRGSLERVLAIDPAFQQGSADRALGRWYYKVPGLFGGSKQKSEMHLRRALTYNPQSTVTHYFLAETLEALGRRQDARAELQKVLEAPLDPEWAPEDREWKEKAKVMLNKIDD